MKLLATLLLSSIFVGLCPSKAQAQTPIKQSDFISSQVLKPELSERVTSVSQLVDVQPTDWANLALGSLVERYVLLNTQMVAGETEC